MNSNRIELPKILFIKIFKYLQYNYESIEIKIFKIYKLIRVLNRDYRDNIAPKFEYEYIIRNEFDLESLISMDISDILMANLTIYSSHVIKCLSRRYIHILLPLINHFYTCIDLGDLNFLNDPTTLQLSQIYYQLNNLLVKPRVNIETLQITFSGDFVVTSETLIEFKNLKSLKLTNISLKTWFFVVNGVEWFSKLCNLTTLHLHVLIIYQNDLINLISKSQSITSMVLERVKLTNEKLTVSTSNDLFDTLSTSKFITNFVYQNENKPIYTVNLSFKSLVNMLNTNSILKRLKLSNFVVDFEENLFISNNTIESISTSDFRIVSPNRTFHQGSLVLYWNVPSNLKELDYFENCLLDEPEYHHNHFYIQTLNYYLSDQSLKDWAHLKQILECSKHTLTILCILSTYDRRSVDFPTLFNIISNFKSITTLEIYIDVPTGPALHFIRMNIPNIKNLYIKVKPNNTTFLNLLGDVMKFNNSIENLHICDNQYYKPVFEFFKSLLPLINHQSLTLITVISIYDSSPQIDSEIDHLYNEFEKYLKLNLHHLRKLKFKTPSESDYPKYQKFVTLVHKLFLNDNWSK
ncbi:hypothetical protein DLAC_11719 [Tieghemostelium lacteum]|uniref:Uncharacterized protein n=1 Tax=Tieghemostelium lacteum TaxID=361077 RepID=A0A151ZBX0_TIELA|nr:hypothetical protein DLAC_11719 [Tieghemostelium lacteum]|eukprot:KYQ91447.1 hypothetical protein DLAC_11719 [Tieghemostelium lacteum]